MLSSERAVPAFPECSADADCAGQVSEESSVRRCDRPLRGSSRKKVARAPTAGKPSGSFERAALVSAALFAEPKVRYACGNVAIGPAKQPILRAEGCTPELAQVQIHWRMPLGIPVKIPWESGNPVEHATEQVTTHVISR